MPNVLKRSGVRDMEGVAKETRDEDGEDVEDDGASLDDGEGDLDDEPQEEEVPSDEDADIGGEADHPEVVGAQSARGRPRFRTESRRRGAAVGPEEHDAEHDDSQQGGSDESPCHTPGAKRRRHRPSSGSRGSASVHAPSLAADSAKKGAADFWISKMSLDEIADGLTKGCHQLYQTNLLMPKLHSPERRRLTAHRGLFPNSRNVRGRSDAPPGEGYAAVEGV